MSLLTVLLACVTRSWSPEVVPLGEPQLSPIGEPDAVCEAELLGENGNQVSVRVALIEEQNHDVLQSVREDEIAHWDDQDYGLYWLFYSGIFFLSGTTAFIGDEDAPTYEPIAPLAGTIVICGSGCGLGIGGLMLLMDDRKAGRRKGDVRQDKLGTQLERIPSSGEEVWVEVQGVTRASARTDETGEARFMAVVRADDPVSWMVRSRSGATCALEVAGTRSQTIERKARIADHLERGEFAEAVADLPPPEWPEEQADALWAPIRAALEAAIEQELNRDRISEAAALVELAPVSRRAELSAPVTRARSAACGEARLTAEQAWLKVALEADTRATEATKKLLVPSDTLDSAAATVGFQVGTQVEAGLKAGRCPTNPYFGITYNGRMYDEDCPLLRDLGTLDEMLGEAYRAAWHGRVSWHFARAAEACDRAEHAGGSETLCQDLWADLRTMEYGIETGSGMGLVAVAKSASADVVDTLDGWRPEGVDLSLGALVSAARSLNARAEEADEVYDQVYLAWNGHEAVTQGRAPTSTLEALEEARGHSVTRSLRPATEDMVLYCE